MSPMSARLGTKVTQATLVVVLTLPVSQNYQLQEWSIGGGGGQSQSSNYQIQSNADPAGANQLDSSNYQIDPGLPGVLLANTPPAPTFENPSRWYNRLAFTLSHGNNPTDTLFAVAISPDNFTTTYYIQSDNTIGDTLGSEDWRSYTDWGNGVSITVTGLIADTTYTVKAKALQGDFTETGWGPTAQATTQPPLLTFDIDTASTDQETSSPYSISFGELEADVVNTASDLIWIDFDTNAEGGGSVYVTSENAGLSSTTTGATIPSVSANLSGASEGYGLRVDSVSETAEGPLVAETPYNGSGDTVGTVDPTIRPLLTSVLSPIQNGRGSIQVKTKISEITPAGTDYTDTLTLIASSTY